MIINSPAYIIGLFPNTIKRDETGEIKGVKYIKVCNDSRKICYEVHYKDNDIAYIPLSDVEDGKYGFSTLA